MRTQTRCESQESARRNSGRRATPLPSQQRPLYCWQYPRSQPRSCRGAAAGLCSQRFTGPLRAPARRFGGAVLPPGGRVQHQHQPCPRCPPGHRDTAGAARGPARCGMRDVRCAMRDAGVSQPAVSPSKAPSPCPCPWQRVELGDG